MSFRAKSHLPKTLPRTFADAIYFTKLLRYRFLWIDEYCIDQGSSQHKLQQISRMDEIYSGADLTIVAAAGQVKSYGLPGVNTTQRKRIPVVPLENLILFSNGPEPKRDNTDSEWFTRALYAPSWRCLVQTCN